MLKNKIKNKIKIGLSTDAIVGMFLNKKCSNKDEILKIIQEYKWQQWKNKC